MAAVVVAILKNTKRVDPDGMMKHRMFIWGPFRSLRVACKWMGDNSDQLHRFCDDVFTQDLFARDEWVRDSEIYTNP